MPIGFFRRSCSDYTAQPRVSAQSPDVACLEDRLREQTWVGVGLLLGGYPACILRLLHTHAHQSEHDMRQGHKASPVELRVGTARTRSLRSLSLRLLGARLAV